MSYCSESENGTHEIVDVFIDDYESGEPKVKLTFICDVCGAEGTLVAKVDAIEWPEEDE